MRSNMLPDSPVQPAGGARLLISILLISMGKQGENWCHTADSPSMKFPPRVYSLYPWIITGAAASLLIF